MAAPLHDKLESRTKFAGNLVFDTPFAVGDRSSFAPAATDSPVIRYPDGRPFIPGSSLKGVLRSTLERLLRGAQHPKLNACDPFASPCVDSTRKDEFRKTNFQNGKIDEEAYANALFGASCTMCQLFGSHWFAGRLQFRDAAVPAESMRSNLVQVRNGVGIDRDTGSARKSILYDLETVAAGLTIPLEILGENLKEWEVGLFLTVLGMMEAGEIPVGSRTTRGLGHCKLQNLAITRADARSMLLPGRGAQAQMPREPFEAALRANLEA